MKFAEKVMEMLSEGISNFGPQIGAELQRQVTQTSAELGSALFNGSAYVQYGAGQYLSSPEIGGNVHGSDAMEIEHQMERGRDM